MREALEKPDGPLARQELEGLEKLEAGNHSIIRGLLPIKDLTGLEHCVSRDQHCPPGPASSRMGVYTRRMTVGISR